MTNTPDLASIKLPYDVKTGYGTFLKGVDLQTLVNAIIRHASPEYQERTKAFLDNFDVEAFKKDFPHWFKRKEQRDIASIVKPLEWENDHDIIYRAKIKGTYIYTPYNIKRYDEDHFRLRKGDLFIHVDYQIDLDAAKAEAFNLYVKDTLNRLDLTKLQQPEPFWKPIEQCPKEKDVFYLIRSGGCMWCAEYVHVDDNFGWWSDVEDNEVANDCDITHYAEIPPCEEQS